MKLNHNIVNKWNFLPVDGYTAIVIKPFLPRIFTFKEAFYNEKISFNLPIFNIK